MQVETTPKATSGIPGDLLRVLRSAGSALASAPPASRTRGSRANWAEVITECQRVANAAAAMQNEAIVALAAIEPVELEDGTEVETHRARGHVALDAPAIVSGALAISSAHAERRVRAAVHLAGDGAIEGTHDTGLKALHVAMRRGDLDAYRVGVVAEELEVAPPDVSAAVVVALGEHLHTDTAPRLRSRCRTLLAKVSPELVRQRAQQARERCALRRWAEEPGIDKWEGTFPSEDAARAWAAIDARAQQLVADGGCERVDRARAQALIDLVTGSATIQTVVTLTVPATLGVAPNQEPDHGSVQQALATRGPTDGDAPTGAPGATDSWRPEVPPAPETTPGPVLHAAGTGSPRSPEDLVELSTGRSVQPLLVPRGFVERLTSEATTTIVVRRCHGHNGSLVDDTSSSAYRPPQALAALVRQRDGRCRFPGCHVNARFCDLDHVRPWPGGPTRATNLICLCRRHHRVKQRPGWRVRLEPDSTVTWADPTGRTRSTHPVDALHALVLPAAADAGMPSEPVTPRAPTARITDVFSAVEFGLEHALAGLTRTDHVRLVRQRRVTRARGDGLLRIDLHADRLGTAPVGVAAGWGPHPGGHRHPRPGAGDGRDDPPF